jgi:hypothetical protein
MIWTSDTAWMVIYTILVALLTLAWVTVPA